MTASGGSGGQAPRPGLSPDQGPGRRPVAGHDHRHPAGGADGPGQRRALALTLAVTVTILLVEVAGAAVSGSLALLADAGHMLTDAAGLGVALFAAVLADRPPTARRTWGFRRAEVLAAAGQALLLLVVGVLVLVEAVRRLVSPPPVAAGSMIVFGVVGLVGNALSILVLARRRSANLNLRAAFLEVVNDALGSLAVLGAAAVIAATGLTRADAVASLVIGGLIVPRTIVLLRETIGVLLESTPPGMDLDRVREHMLGVEHVRAVHDLHASTVATGLPVLTGHVVVDASCFYDGHVPRLLDELQECLAGHFDVAHSTLQFEAAEHAGHERPGHR